LGLDTLCVMTPNYKGQKQHCVWWVYWPEISRFCCSSDVNYATTRQRDWNIVEQCYINNWYCCSVNPRSVDEQ